MIASVAIQVIHELCTKQAFSSESRLVCPNALQVKEPVTYYVISYYVIRYGIRCNDLILGMSVSSSRYMCC